MKVKREEKYELEIIITKIQKLKRRRKNLKEKGITLVALTITIIILLILAGVTLTTALGQNGLFQRAKIAVEEYELAQENEEDVLEELYNQLGNLISNKPKEKTTGPNGKPLPKTVTGTNHGDVEGEDRLGNPVVIPGGFRFAGEENDTVEEGIIIEDGEGNQFVWIPVSNTDGDNNEETNNQNEKDLITLKDNTKVEITLGRYTFNSNNGNPALAQAGNDCEKTVLINPYFQETVTHPNGGKAASDLNGFVESVKKNHGYYIGRYEASFGSGDTPTGKYNVNDYGVYTIMTNQKPTVKPTKKSDTDETVHSNSSANSVMVGDLWKMITQFDATIVSQNMYKGNEYVISDLVNSYAWDTAIVYIQKMENINYANQTREMNTTLKNTGETGDEKCHIFDMSGNLMEWTTEYSTDHSMSFAQPCVDRGGYWNDGSFSTSSRAVQAICFNNERIGFRPLLYLIKK